MSVLAGGASATEADVPDNTLTFSLVGTHSGMKINGSRGVISLTQGEEQGASAKTISGGGQRDGRGCAGQHADVQSGGAALRDDDQREQRGDQLDTGRSAGSEHEHDHGGSYVQRGAGGELDEQLYGDGAGSECGAGAECAGQSDDRRGEQSGGEARRERG